VTTAVVVGNLYAGAWRADADFIQTNFVSDIPGLAALTDPILQNPWGISHNATSPFWISDQRTNIATLYAVAPNLMKVAPAGIDVFNSSFQLVNNGAFTTPAAISAHKLVPFNVQTLNNGDVAVTYAPEGRPAQIAATPGQGAVAIFDATGTTVKQTILGNPGNT